MKKLVALLLICLVAIATVFASGAKEDGTKSYTFAMNCEWPPLEYVDENGEITGFEVDLIKEMSKVSGVEMKYINTAVKFVFPRYIRMRRQEKRCWGFTRQLLSKTETICICLLHR